MDFYEIFNEAAMSANTPFNNANPIQKQMIQDKIAEMPTNLADKAKAFLKNNWKVLTVGAALLALGGAAYYNRDAIADWQNKSNVTPAKADEESPKPTTTVTTKADEEKPKLTAEQVKSLENSSKLESQRATNTLLAKENNLKTAKLKIDELFSQAKAEGGWFARGMVSEIAVKRVLDQYKVTEDEVGVQHPTFSYEYYERKK